MRVTVFEEIAIYSTSYIVSHHMYAIIHRNMHEGLTCDRHCTYLDYSLLFAAIYCLLCVMFLNLYTTACTCNASSHIVLPGTAHISIKISIHISIKISIYQHSTYIYSKR
jgi:hypothetical protein